MDTKHRAASLLLVMPGRRRLIVDSLSIRPLVRSSVTKLVNTVF